MPPPHHIRQCWPPPCIDKGREYYLMAPMYRDAMPPPPQRNNINREPLIERRTSYPPHPCNGCFRNNRSRSVEDTGRQLRWPNKQPPSPPHINNNNNNNFNINNNNWNKENGPQRRKSVENLLDSRPSGQSKFPPHRRRVCILY